MFFFVFKIRVEQLKLPGALDSNSNSDCNDPDESEERGSDCISNVARPFSSLKAALIRPSFIPKKDRQSSNMRATALINANENFNTRESVHDPAVKKKGKALVKIQSFNDQPQVYGSEDKNNSSENLPNGKERLSGEKNGILVTRTNGGAILKHQGSLNKQNAEIISPSRKTKKSIRWAFSKSKSNMETSPSRTSRTNDYAIDTNAPALPTFAVGMQSDQNSPKGKMLAKNKYQNMMCGLSLKTNLFVTI